MVIPSACGGALSNPPASRGRRNRSARRRRSLPSRVLQPLLHGGEQPAGVNDPQGTLLVTADGHE